MHFRLRYLKHDVELSPGIFTIGRSTRCQLSLDDPLVSRQHARLIVDQEHISIEDIESRNGIFVNGERIQGRTLLQQGDQIIIGAQEIIVLATPSSENLQQTLSHSDSSARLGHPTMVSIPAATAVPSVRSTTMLNLRQSQVVSPDESTIEAPRRSQALSVLGVVAHKALALGNAEHAERLLASILHDILAEIRSEKEIPIEQIHQAAHFAARLASGTGKASWGDFVFEMYHHQKILPAQNVVDELYTAARKMKGFNLTSFRNYLTAMRKRASEYSPNERFILQRLESFEQLIASR